MDLLEWDAATYDSLPLPHERWGAGVIERLDLRGDETVIDLGCGTGRDTERLLDRLPGGRVVAVDGSLQMLDRLRERLGPRLDRVEVVHADLTQPFPEVVRGNAAMSVATFHWVPDHPALFRRVAAALPRNGRFEAEFGGAGNIAGFLQAVERAGGPKDESPWDFAGREDTIEALLGAGFQDVHVRVVEDPAVLERGPQLEAFIATVLLGATLRDMDPEEGRALVKRVAAELPEPVIDYVRMQISAVRA
ncbi:MAG TPA: class I SAM-dependent methyltransferase [Amnibacterium sp.]